jgi:UDP-glucose 4-epimerase
MPATLVAHGLKRDVVMSERMTVLVSGGAGYIGSHMVLALLDAGHTPVIIDDFSTGHEKLVPSGVSLFRGNAGDSALVAEICDSHKIDTVAHFAASIVVPESVVNPLKYYLNNTVNTTRFIAACVNAGIKRFVFSSTAAVYGNQDVTPIHEDANTQPENPYGSSKLMSEMVLRDSAAASDLSYVILRYFNVAGADSKRRSGQLSQPATHLIKIAVEAAVGKRSAIQVYGTDYPTPDGTCIRDYIHVSDLIAAHMAALIYLQKGGAPMLANCGYGHGSSVRDVLDVVASVAGRPLDVTDAPRRPGDAAVLVANSAKLRSALGWTPRFDDLRQIVSDALAWEVNNS